MNALPCFVIISHLAMQMNNHILPSIDSMLFPIVINVINLHHHPCLFFLAIILREILILHRNKVSINSVQPAVFMAMMFILWDVISQHWLSKPWTSTFAKIFSNSNTSIKVTANGVLINLSLHQLGSNIKLHKRTSTTDPKSRC